jgi:hypothetical protein
MGQYARPRIRRVVNINMDLGRNNMGGSGMDTVDSE